MVGRVVSIPVFELARRVCLSTRVKPVESERGGLLEPIVLAVAAEGFLRGLAGKDVGVWAFGCITPRDAEGLLEPIVLAVAAEGFLRELAGKAEGVVLFLWLPG